MWNKKWIRQSKKKAHIRKFYTRTTIEYPISSIESEKCHSFHIKSFELLEYFFSREPKRKSALKNSLLLSIILITRALNIKQLDKHHKADCIIERNRLFSELTLCATYVRSSGLALVGPIFVSTFEQTSEKKTTKKTKNKWQKWGWDKYFWPENVETKRLLLDYLWWLKQNNFLKINKIDRVNV